MLYVLNAVPGSALIGRRGKFESVSTETAKSLLQQGPWQSEVEARGFDFLLIVTE